MLYGTGSTRLASKVSTRKEVIWNMEDLRRGKVSVIVVSVPITSSCTAKGPGDSTWHCHKSDGYPTDLLTCGHARCCHPACFVTGVVGGIPGILQLPGFRGR